MNRVANRDVNTGKRAGRPPESEGLCRFLESLVAAAFGVPMAEVRGVGRGSAAAAFARHAAIYIAHVSFGMSAAETGRCFGRDRTTIAHAAERIGEMRDDARHARMFDCLEAAALGWAEKFGQSGGKR